MTHESAFRYYVPVTVSASPSFLSNLTLSETHKKLAADSVFQILWKIKICNFWINAFLGVYTYICIYIYFRNYTVQLYHDFKWVYIHINPFCPYILQHELRGFCATSGFWVHIHTYFGDKNNYCYRVTSQTDWHHFTSLDLSILPFSSR